jgi:hypothetical protein
MAEQIDLAAAGILLDQELAPGATDTIPVDNLYRPTLAIGIGGTGTSVLKRLKRLIKDQFGDEHTELFQLLAIDTEFEKMDRGQRLEVGEFLNLAETTILGDDIVAAMSDENTKEIYGALSTWWPTSDKGPFWPGDITSGAKATRCVGRMALWYRGTQAYRAIERKLETALLIRGLRRDDVPATGNAVKIFIVCSLAGGTGSGMYLDIAYIVRDILSRMGLVSFITGVLLTDAKPFDRFLQEQGLLRRMRANIYAALCELDWFMGGYEAQEGHRSSSNSGPLYSMEYLNSTPIRSNAKPFDVCYLVNTMNEHSRRLRGIEDVTAMMAQEIFLEIASPLGRTGRSALDNVERLSYFSEYGPRPLAYSSMAVSSLNLRAERVTRQCTLSLSKRVFERLTETRADGAIDLPARVKTLLRDLPLNTDDAAAALLRHMEADPESLLPELQLPTGVTKNRQETEAIRLRGDLKYDMEQRVKPAYRQAQQTLSEEYSQQLDQIVRILLGRGLFSLDQVSEVAETWRRQVESALTEMRDEEAAAREEADAWDAKVDSSLAQMRKVAAGPERRMLVFTTHSERRMEEATRDCVNGLQEWAECVQSEYQWQTLTGIFNHLSRALDDYRENTTRLRQFLRNTSSEVSEALSTLQARMEEGSHSYQLEFEALDSSDLDKLTDRLIERTDQDTVVPAILEELGTLDADRSSEDPWGARIIEHLGRVVRDQLDAEGLLEILRFIHEDESAGIERQLKKLGEYAAPFWHLTLTNCPEASEWSVITLIGYAGASAATSGSFLERMLRQVVDRYESVDIAEPNRMILLNTKHGVPLFALSQCNGMMRDAYYSYRGGWLMGKPGVRPVHVSQEWMEMQDLNPTPLV